MLELVAKSGMKVQHESSIVWDYFGLERGSDRKPIDDSEVVCHTSRRVIARNGNMWLKLAG